MAGSAPLVPVALRVHLAHAVTQSIAVESGVHLLHIKGPAANACLRTSERQSADADVLVRPSHLPTLSEALRKHGWEQLTHLPSQGLIEHSTNWYHGQLGQLDLHVRFPGISLPAEQAFDKLWAGRGTVDIAHTPCTVPSVTAHRLILLLHAARDIPNYGADIEAAWTNSSVGEQEQLRRLAFELDAEVPLASAIGELESYRGRAEYQIWRPNAQGTATTGLLRAIAEIRARPSSAPNDWLKILNLAWHVATRTPRRLETKLGRKPTVREVAESYLQFLRRSLGRGQERGE